MKYTHIIWDFNGTLLDDVEIGIQTVNRLLEKRNLKTIKNAEEYRNVFCFPVKEYYRKLGFDFDAEGYDVLAEEWVGQYLSIVDDAPLRDGVLDVLKRLDSAGFDQIILSATESAMLKKQLRSLDIDKYFSDILGLDNIYAHSKAEIARLWARENSPVNALMIGDTAHDREVAAYAGFDCILVANGHQPKETLIACGVPVIESIGEVIDMI